MRLNWLIQVDSNFKKSDHKLWTTPFYAAPSIPTKPTAYIRRASLKAHLAVDIAGAMCEKVLSFFTWALTFARE